MGSVDRKCRRSFTTAPLHVQRKLSEGILIVHGGKHTNTKPAPPDDKNRKKKAKAQRKARKR